MKNLISFFLVVVLLSLSACAEKVDINSEKAKIQGVLEKYHQAVNNEDMEMISQVFSSDNDIILINADSTMGIGWKSVKELFQKWLDSSEHISYTFKDEFIRIHPSANTAWVFFIQYGNEIYQDKPTSFEEARATFGLEKRNDNWFVVQAHFSFPVAGWVVD